MKQIYSPQVKERVKKAFSYSLNQEDQGGKEYSFTGIKKAIAEGEKIKVSDVDKMLYGSVIDVGEAYKPYKQFVLNWYNNTTLVDGERKKLSIKEIAKRLGEFTGKRESTSKVYKILYSLENQDYNVEWRGSPIRTKADHSNIRQYHARNVETAAEQNEPAAGNLERKIRIREEMMPKASWRAYAGIAATAVFGTLALLSGSARNYLGNKAYANENLATKVPVVQEEARQESPAEVPRLVIESPKPQKQESRPYMNTFSMPPVAFSDNLLLQEVRPRSADLMKQIRQDSDTYWDTIFPSETTTPKDTWTLSEKTEIQNLSDSTSNSGFLGSESLLDTAELISRDESFLN